MKPLVFISPVIGGVILSGWALVQGATHIDMSIPDLITLGTALSAFPGGAVLVLIRVWKETDKNLKDLIDRVGKVEGMCAPCQLRSSNLEGKVRDMVEDLANRNQAAIMEVERRLEAHIDR